MKFLDGLRGSILETAGVPFLLLVCGPGSDTGFEVAIFVSCWVSVWAAVWLPVASSLVQMRGVVWTPGLV